MASVTVQWGTKTAVVTNPDIAKMKVTLDGPGVPKFHKEAIVEPEITSYTFDDVPAGVGYIASVAACVPDGSVVEGAQGSSPLDVPLEATVPTTVTISLA